MSLLEWIGLDALLGDGAEGFGAAAAYVFAPVLGVAFIVFCVLAIIYQELIDKVSVVMNLFIGIIFVAFVLIRYFLNYKKTKSKFHLTFLIIGAVVTVVFFIVGLLKRYHCLIFDYEYLGIWSGFATTLYPNVLLFMVYQFLNTEDHFFSKIGASLKVLGLMIAFFLCSALLSIFLFVAVAIADGESFIDDHFIAFRNINFNGERKKWDCKDYDKCIMDGAKEYVAGYRDDLYERNIKDYKYFIDHGNTEIAEQRYVMAIKSANPFIDYKDYGFVFYDSVWRDDYNVIYKVRNKEFKGVYTYYEVNWQTNELKESTGKAYKQLEEEKKNK